MISPLRMFDTLWAPGQHSLCAQTNGQPFRSTGFYAKPKDLIRAATRLSPESNVWWGVHGMEPPTRGRGGVSDVVAVTTLAADFDWSDADAHKGTTLPSETEVRAAVGLMPRPTVVVNSGHGLQAYWGLAEVLDRDDGEELSDGFFRWIEAEFGLHNDRTDLASVLRMPGTLNNKSRPVPVEIEYVDRFCGYQAAFLRENCWLDVPQIPVRSVAARPSVPVVSNAFKVSDLDGSFDDSGETPFEWLNRTFDSTAALLRLGWVEGPRRGSEQQFTRPGKDPRKGTSATLHLDTGAVNIYSVGVDPIYGQIGLPGKGCMTLTRADLWMVENGVTDRSEASRLIRRMMPSGPRAPARTPDPLMASTDDRQVPSVGLNIPEEFWSEREWLTHIRQAAWSMSCSPDAVLAAVLARYSANLHPSIMLPDWGTLDVFVVIAGHSGAYKSKAGKTARKLWPGTGDRAVMMDRNVGSGEGLAEAFFEWRDENGDPCGPSKKGAHKVRTRWGLHFATDESTALTAAAARNGSIVIQTMCQAWMGEAIGQLLADPSKSRMIEPNTVRVSAELKIQTIHGHRLFADEYASTGLAQRMVCFSSLDPSIFDRFEAGTPTPDWPGELDLPRPFILTGAAPRIMELAPAIKAHLAAAAAAGHNPAWSGDPLDTHVNLSRLKIAGLMTLMDDRFTIEDADWVLAGMAIATHSNVRTALQNTKRQIDRDAKVTAVTAQIEKEIGIDDGKHKALVRRTVAALQTRIEAGKSIGKKHLSGYQRDVYEEAMQLLEAQGTSTRIPMVDG